jgi:hypothetical protein
MKFPVACGWSAGAETCAGGFDGAVRLFCKRVILKPQQIAGVFWGAGGSFSGDSPAIRIRMGRGWEDNVRNLLEVPGSIFSSDYLNRKHP